MAIYPEIDRDTFAKAVKGAPRDDSIIGDLWARVGQSEASVLVKDHCRNSWLYHMLRD